MGPGGGPSLSDSGTLIRSPPTLLVTASLRSFLPTLFLHAASCTEFSKRFHADADVSAASAWLVRRLGKVQPSRDTVGRHSVSIPSYLFSNIYSGFGFDSTRWRGWFESVHLFRIVFRYFAIFNLICDL